LGHGYFALIRRELDGNFPIGSGLMRPESIELPAFAFEAPCISANRPTKPGQLRSGKGSRRKRIGGHKLRRYSSPCAAAARRRNSVSCEFLTDRLRARPHQCRSGLIRALSPAFALLANLSRSPAGSVTVKCQLVLGDAARVGVSALHLYAGIRRFVGVNPWRQGLGIERSGRRRVSG
jgi:hypothetical protein